MRPLLGLVLGFVVVGRAVVCSSSEYNMPDALTTRDVVITGEWPSGQANTKDSVSTSTAHRMA